MQPTSAAPKIDFFTPASFKHVAEHVKSQLTHGTGFEWRITGINKNDRKLGAGSRELYFEAKLFPADKAKPASATVEATLETAGTQARIRTSVRVEKSFKAIFEAAAEPKDFSEAQQWFQHLSFPQDKLDLVKTSTLVERVAARYLRRG